MSSSKEYMLAWRKANPEKVKVSRDKARAKLLASPEKIRAYRRAYYLANIDKKRAYTRRRYLKNADKLRAQSRAWAQANPERAREKVREWNRKNPEKVKAFNQRSREKLQAIKVARGCKRCGFREHHSALQFHHRDPGQKKFGISRRRYQAVLEELQKCDVLCANCHFIIHAENKANFTMPTQDTIQNIPSLPLSALAFL